MKLLQFLKGGTTEDNKKMRLIFILGVISILFLIGMIASCNRALQNKVARDKEMITRLDLEEKMGKFMQDSSAITEKLSAIAGELEKERGAHEATQAILKQEQLVNASLKEELQKLTKIKEALEQDLKAAVGPRKPPETKK